MGKRDRTLDLRLYAAETEALLNTIVSDLSSLNELSSLLKTTARKIGEIFPVSGVAIYLLDVIGGKRLEEKARQGLANRRYPALARKALRDGASCSARSAAFAVEADEVIGVIVLSFRSSQVEFRTDLITALARYLATRILEIRGRSLIARQLPESVVARLPLDPEKLIVGAKRVTATIVFADVRGFTTLSERIGTETLQGFLNAYFTQMESLIKSYGGTVVKFLADGVLAVFGVPDGHKDHTLQGTKCALLMLRTFEEKLAHSIPGESLSIGIGIHRGSVMAGYFGSPERLAFDIIGDPVNTASRIQETARDAIHASASAYRSVRERVEALKLEPHELKGKRQKQDIYIIKKVLG